jgi:hypothetical protein
MMVIVLSFIFGFIESIIRSRCAPQDIEWRHMVLFYVFLVIAGLVWLIIPFAMQLLFAILANTRFTDAVWTRPTHESNPFHCGNPLLFFHFIAYVFIAVNLGAILSSPWSGVVGAVLGVHGVIDSLLILFGVHLGMRWFKHKMSAATRG